MQKQRIAGNIKDTLILVEHEPVYTLGKNANRHHLLQSRDKSVEIYNIERGGDVTFHGPGQLVGYPILDLRNYTKVKKIKHKFKDGPRSIHVLLIDNPCTKKDFPKEVNRIYFCNGQKLNKEEVHVVDSKLVIGILYEAKKCQKTDIKKIESNEITGKFCAFKNDIPLEKMNIGMGDIFIKMAR